MHVLSPTETIRNPSILVQFFTHTENDPKYDSPIEATHITAQSNAGQGHMHATPGSAHSPYSAKWLRWLGPMDAQIPCGNIASDVYR